MTWLIKHEKKTITKNVEKIQKLSKTLQKKIILLPKNVGKDYIRKKNWTWTVLHELGIKNPLNSI